MNDHPRHEAADRDPGDEHEDELDPAALLDRVAAHPKHLGAHDDRNDCERARQDERGDTPRRPGSGRSACNAPGRTERTCLKW